MGAYVVNRVRRSLGPMNADTASSFEAWLQDEQALKPHSKQAREDTAKQVLQRYEQYAQLVQKDTASLQSLTHALSTSIPLIAVPDFDEDIHSLDGLKVYGERLANPPTDAH